MGRLGARKRSLPGFGWTGRYGLEPRGAVSYSCCSWECLSIGEHYSSLKDPQLNLDENGSACVVRGCGIHFGCDSLGSPNLLLLSIFQHDCPFRYDWPSDRADLLLPARAVWAFCPVGVFPLEFTRRRRLTSP